MVFSTVDCEILLAHVVCNTAALARTITHVVATHEIKHDIFELRQIGLWIYSILVYLICLRDNHKI